MTPRLRLDPYDPPPATKEAPMEMMFEQTEEQQKLVEERQAELTKQRLRKAISDLPATEVFDVLSAEIAKLRKALEEIRDHWANEYDHLRKGSEMYRGTYGIGITDGHRACAIIARTALESAEGTTK